ncbi:MAG: DUF4315 family protein [bacterium]|nr:DUF4315 family protein [bacterium]
MGSLKQIKKDIDKYQRKADEFLSKVKELKEQEREQEDKDIVESVRKDLSYEEFVLLWDGLKERKRAVENSPESEREENINTERTSENETQKVN